VTLWISSIKKFSLMMEAVCASETPADFNMTKRHHMPEDSEFLYTVTALKKFPVYLKLGFMKTCSQ
jgi:hypothetical protein